MEGELRSLRRRVENNSIQSELLLGRCGVSASDVEHFFDSTALNMSAAHREHARRETLLSIPLTAEERHQVVERVLALRPSQLEKLFSAVTAISAESRISHISRVTLKLKKSNPNRL